MLKQLNRAVSLGIAAFIASQVPFALADDKTEGKVVGTKLTACDMKNYRCEGTLELQTGGGDKTEPLTIRVVGDTAIKKGDEKIYLPALRGSVVTVNYVTEKGEKVAKAIEVVPAKGK